MILRLTSKQAREFVIYHKFLKEEDIDTLTEGKFNQEERLIIERAVKDLVKEIERLQKTNIGHSEWNVPLFVMEALSLRHFLQNHTARGIEKYYFSEDVQAAKKIKREIYDKLSK